MLSSLVTTVATPRKWPGRWRASGRRSKPLTSTKGCGDPSSSGYISPALGTKSRSTPAAASLAASSSSVRG